MSRWNRKSLGCLQALYAASDSTIPLNLPKVAPRKKKPDVESERHAQQRLVMWLRDSGILFFAVPNGANVAAHHRQVLISEGLESGVPDLMICCARGSWNGMFVELKREDGGSKVSQNQKKWLANLTKENYYAVVAFGYEKAKKQIQWYLNGAKDEQG